MGLLNGCRGWGGEVPLCLVPALHLLLLLPKSPAYLGEAVNSHWSVFLHPKFKPCSPLGVTSETSLASIICRRLPTLRGTSCSAPLPAVRSLSQHQPLTPLWTWVSAGV